VQRWWRIVPDTRSHGSANLVWEKSGDFVKVCQFLKATPVSTTAIFTPLAPGRPSALRLAQACGASTPARGRKFHWSFSQPLALVVRPVSSG
jgi:hypothetical protein